MFTVLRSPLYIVALVPVLAFAGDVGKGHALYAPCAACHGEQAEGNAALKAPALAGQSTTYLARQLDHFRSGMRGADEADIAGQQMRPMAAALPDTAAIADVLAYIATLPAPRVTTTPVGDAVAGNKAYQGACGACHGGRGEGNDALNAPRLNTLDADYLVEQVGKFRSGLRGAHADDRLGRQMAMMAAVVDDRTLRDIAAYLNDARQD